MTVTALRRPARSCSGRFGDFPWDLRVSGSARPPGARSVSGQARDCSVIAELGARGGCRSRPGCPCEPGRPSGAPLGLG